MPAITQPLVTVLTPVYNGEKYLVECIESVLAQSYQNWEYHIINNCSTDGTLTIAEAYAARDSRIRVTTNTQFVGVQENHNIAFRTVPGTSKYCKVVHADDWLFPDCIEKMVTLAEANPSVGIVGAYGLRNTQVVWDGLPYPSTTVNGREICRNLLKGGSSVFGTPTSVLYRSEEVRRRSSFFNEMHLHSDTEACLDVLQKTDFGFVHQVLTYTRVHANNASEFDTVALHLPEIEMLYKYGPVYLQDDEFKEQARSMWDRYYTSLGSKVFRNRNKQFWHYHRTTLKRLGHALQVSRIGMAVFLKVLDLGLNPFSTSLRVARRIGVL